VKLLALTQPKLDLHAAVLEIQAQRDQRHAVLHHARVQLDDLALVHQQPPGPHRIQIEDIAVLIGADVDAADEELAILDRTVGVLQIDVAAADGFDLGPGQLDAGLEALQNKVFMKGLAVSADLLRALLLWHGTTSHGKNRPPSPVGRLKVAAILSQPA